MPLPRALARFNVGVTNRVLGPIVVHLPGFAMVVHEGRRSGRRYETPLLIFERGDRAVIALTYGPETDWAQNILAAGGCEAVRSGRVRRFTGPKLVHDPTRRLVPRAIRPILRVLGVADFLILTPLGDDGGARPSGPR